MSQTGVRVTRADGWATVAFDRPEALNALTAEVLEAATAAILGLSDVGVIVLTGQGRAFSAGVDLKALGDRRLDGGSVGDILDLPARALIEAITTVPQIVIAKVNGACFTGALEIALACDLLVAADEAKFGDTHAKFGLRPTWGMSARLWRAVGPTRARQLSYTAATFTGRQAAEWGVATDAVPAAALDDRVEELVGAVLANSRGSLAAYKDLYRRSFGVGLADGLALEAASTYEITDTEARVAGFRR
ncbi:MAG TPA: enoyl-CoA hydratase/isomerase family protein [Acidimicrobiales bacterium]|nr:enoyl-CoA hydratase/isomerase family protein [Acidimicrobiales bacterium]